MQLPMAVKSDKDLVDEHTLMTIRQDEEISALTTIRPLNMALFASFYLTLIGCGVMKLARISRGDRRLGRVSRMIFESEAGQGQFLMYVLKFYIASLFTLSSFIGVNILLSGINPFAIWRLKKKHREDMEAFSSLMSQDAIDRIQIDSFQGEIQESSDNFYKSEEEMNEIEDVKGKTIELEDGEQLDYEKVKSAFGLNEQTIDLIEQESTNSKLRARVKMLKT